MSSVSASPRSTWRRLGAAAPVGIALSFWPPLGGFLLLATLTQLGPWLRAHGTAGMISYLAIAGVLIGFSFLPTFACAILAGWAFGFAVGWPLAMVAITAGGVIAYAIGRWIARDRVLEVIREHPKWDAVCRSLLETSPARTAFVVALVRIPPASPFALTNFAFAAARVPLREYIVGTVVGIAPRTAMAAFAAAQLEQFRLKDVGDRWMTLAGLAATVVVTVVLGVLAERALRRVT